jgi:serine phosphatase RsbU (regulator of sigma subunit)
MRCNCQTRSGIFKALGIVGDDGFDRQPESVAMKGIHTLLLFSDGLNEARNAQGAMFGLDGVERAVEMAGSASAALEAVKNSALEFVAGREPDDDILLVAIETGF